MGKRQRKLTAEDITSYISNNIKEGENPRLPKLRNDNELIKVEITAENDDNENSDLLIHLKEKHGQKPNIPDIFSLAQQMCRLFNFSYKDGKETKYISPEFDYKLGEDGSDEVWNIEKFTIKIPAKHKAKFVELLAKKSFDKKLPVSNIFEGWSEPNMVTSSAPPMQPNNLSQRDKQLKVLTGKKRYKQKDSIDPKNTRQKFTIAARHGEAKPRARSLR